MPLEAEALKFQKERAKIYPSKPLNDRTYMAGQAMCALLIRSGPSIPLEELRAESYRIAEYMLENN